MLENVLIFPSVVNAVLLPSRVLGIAYHIFLGHSAFWSDICNTGRQIIEYLLDLADSWEPFTASCL